MIKEAILIIPGLDSKIVGFSLDRLIDKISKRQQISSVKVLNYQTGQKRGVELTFTETSKKKIIDIYEVFWGDIINKIYTEDLLLWKKVVFGLELIIFWLFSTIWKGARKNKLLFIAMIISGLVLTGWYVSIVGLVVTAFYNSDFLRGLLGLESKVPAIIPEISFILGVLLGLFPTAIIVKASGFGMKYLKSNLVREEIKERINSKISAIMIVPNSYERVTLLSHSMGAIPALDFLSSYQNVTKTVIRSISVGASISFFANKSLLIRNNFDKCTKNKSINEWTDYFYREDWLCAYDSINKYGKNFNSIELSLDSSWFSRFGGKVHSQYFEDSRVIEKLIAN
jgi:hypothetical protein